MKSILILLTFCGMVTHAFAQFTVGNNGFILKSATILSIDGLSLTPSTDLTVSRNSLVRSTIPVPGNPNGSISRVYRFASPINFNGVTMISYLEPELNSNIENRLQLIHSSDGSVFSTTTGSGVNAGSNFVYNTITNPNLLVVSATQPWIAQRVARINASAISENKETQVSRQSDDPIETDLVSLMGNPVDGDATLMFKVRPKVPVTVSVMDMRGRPVLKRVFAEIPQNAFSLPTNGFPTGFYLLEVSWGANIKTLKMVKL